MPWDAPLALIDPAFSKAGKGPRPYSLKMMLRIHLLKNWFGYSDPALEGALYEVGPLRRYLATSLCWVVADTGQRA